MVRTARVNPVRVTARYAGRIGVLGAAPVPAGSMVGMAVQRIRKSSSGILGMAVSGLRVTVRTVAQQVAESAGKFQRIQEKWRDSD
jgi:phage-related tail protein